MPMVMRYKQICPSLSSRRQQIVPTLNDEMKDVIESAFIGLTHRDIIVVYLQLQFSRHTCQSNIDTYQVCKSPLVQAAKCPCKIYRHI